MDAVLLSNFTVAMKHINDKESELPFLCSSPCVVIDAMKYSSKVCRYLSFKIFSKYTYAGQTRWFQLVLICYSQLVF